MTFQELDQARRFFGLDDRATMKEIKHRYRAMARRFHPDRGEAGDNAQIRKANAAYRLLINYCSGYRFSFAQDEFFEQCPEERLREQFAHDGIWQG